MNNHQLRRFIKGIRNRTLGRPATSRANPADTQSAQNLADLTVVSTAIDISAAATTVAHSVTLEASETAAIVTDLTEAPPADDISATATTIQPSATLEANDDAAIIPSDERPITIRPLRRHLLDAADPESHRFNLFSSNAYRETRRRRYEDNFDLIDRHIENLNQSITRLMARHRTLETQSVTHRTEHDSQLSVLSERLIGLANELDQAMTLRDEITERMNNFEQQLNQNLQQVRDVNITLTSHAELIRTLGGSCAQLRQVTTHQMVQLTQALSHENARLRESLDTQLNEVNMTIADFNHRFMTNRTEEANARGDLAAQMALMNHTNENQINDIRITLAELNELFNNLSDSSAVLRQSNAQQIMEVTRLINQESAILRQHMDAQLAAVNQTIADLNARSNTRLADVTRALNHEAGTLRQDMVAQLAEVNQTITDLNTRSNTRAAEVTHALNHEAGTLRQDMVAQLAEVNQTIADLNARSDTRLADVTRALNQESGALRQELRSQAQAINLSIANIDGRSNANLAELANIRTELTTQVTQLNHAIAALRTELAAVRVTAETNRAAPIIQTMASSTSNDSVAQSTALTPSQAAITTSTSRSRSGGRFFSVSASPSTVRVTQARSHSQLAPCIHRKFDNNHQLLFSLNANNRDVSIVIQKHGTQLSSSEAITMATEYFRRDGRTFAEGKHDVLIELIRSSVASSVAANDLLRENETTDNTVRSSASLA